MAMTAQKDAEPSPNTTPLFVARDEERLVKRDNGGVLTSRVRFGALVTLILFVHAALLAYLLYRDTKAVMETAQLEETPIEVVMEKPPEPQPPPPQAVKPKPPPDPTQAPPPPEPPKVPPPVVKEDLSPATSAPRAVQDTKIVESKQAQPKTASPKATNAPPTAPQEAAAAATPAPEAPASKPIDDRPDAEALDKAKPEVKAKPETKTKPDPKDTKTKVKPKDKSATRGAAQQLAGLQGLQGFSIESPAPRSTVVGGTEDLRYFSIVNGLITRRVKQLPRIGQYQAGGSVSISLHIDHDGRLTAIDYARKSGNPEMDRLVMNAVKQAAPFPPPPQVVGNDFQFTDNFDGQLPNRFTR